MQNTAIQAPRKMAAVNPIFTAKEFSPAEVADLLVEILGKESARDKAHEMIAKFPENTGFTNASKRHNWVMVLSRIIFPEETR